MGRVTSICDDDDDGDDDIDAFLFQH